VGRQLRTTSHLVCGIEEFPPLFFGTPSCQVSLSGTKTTSLELLSEVADVRLPPKLLNPLADTLSRTEFQAQTRFTSELTNLLGGPLDNLQNAVDNRRMAMAISGWSGAQCRCRRCDHRWNSKRDHQPARCPQCWTRCWGQPQPVRQTNLVRVGVPRFARVVSAAEAVRRGLLDPSAI
jgi:hypothetical protein